MVEIVGQTRELHPIDGELNPGVKQLVLWLRELDFNTTDSGDGVTNAAAGMEGTMPFPHVAISPKRDEPTYAALEALDLRAQLEGKLGRELDPTGEVQIQVTWSPIDNRTVILLVGMTDDMLPKENV